MHTLKKQKNNSKIYIFFMWKLEKIKTIAPLNATALRFFWLLYG